MKPVSEEVQAVSKRLTELGVPTYRRGLLLSKHMSYTHGGINAIFSGNSAGSPKFFYEVNKYIESLTSKQVETKVEPPKVGSVTVTYPSLVSTTTLSTLFGFILNSDFIVSLGFTPVNVPSKGLCWGKDDVVSIRFAIISHLASIKD